ncbi:hypothetical protein Tco_1474562 [Tanacetum coccineum]
MPNSPICKASRWKDPKKTKGKKVANKVVRYFSLTPRLQLQITACGPDHIDNIHHTTVMCNEKKLPLMFDDVNFLALITSKDIEVLLAALIKELCSKN